MSELERDQYSAYWIPMGPAFLLTEMLCLERRNGINQSGSLLIGDVNPAPIRLDLSPARLS